MTNINFNFGDKIFEWDSEKAKINFRKHNVDFRDATKVFEDENRLVRYDTKHSYEEERCQVIGKVKDILFVVYTERGDVTRLISARKATAYERSLYYGNRDVYFT